ncbi:hypothetical protein GW17_00011259 [Ensete ventricosum]|nr:hypothetical protein GW17_00011259 [Ensete ventricosum]
MARPSVGVAGHGQAPCKGSRPPTRGRSAAAKAPYKGVIGCSQGPLHRGRSTTASPQGRQPPTSTIACSVAPVRGARQQPAYKGQSPAASPQGAAPTTNQQGVA